MNTEQQSVERRRSAFSREIAPAAFTVMEAFDEDKHPRSGDGKFGPGSQHIGKEGNATHTKVFDKTGAETSHIAVNHGDDTHHFNIGKHPKKPGVRVTHTTRTGGNAFTSGKKTHYHVSGKKPITSSTKILGKHVPGYNAKHEHLRAATSMLEHAIKHFAGAGDTKPHTGERGKIGGLPIENADNKKPPKKKPGGGGSILGLPIR